jgi:hypothetical protein
VFVDARGLVGPDTLFGRSSLMGRVESAIWASMDRTLSFSATTAQAAVVQNAAHLRSLQTRRAIREFALCPPSGACTYLPVSIDDAVLLPPSLLHMRASLRIDVEFTVGVCAH